MSSLRIETDKLHQQLHQANQPSFYREMPAPVLLVGLGTSGCKVMVNAYRIRSDKVGCEHVGVRYIGADVDKDPRRDNLAEKRDISFIPMGQAGAGTNTKNGFEIASNHYDKLKGAFEKAMVSHMEGPDFGFNLPPSQLQTAYVVGGGGGGTSGGAQDRVVTALHAAKRSVGLQKLEIYPWTIGSQMPVMDVTRSVDDDTQDRIAANTSDNLEARYRRMNSKIMMTELPPDGAPFTVESSIRIWGNTEFDNRSREHRVHTNGALFEIMAACLEAQIFTAAGKEGKARRIDDIILGLTGQMNAANGTPI